jgi:glyoxylase-like metal-dependent hydrolase (beta-lactamase superfamily II)
MVALAARRQRNHLRCPTEGLRMLGVDAATVRDVVITHLHYDHVGNFDLFPAATFHLQDEELRYATGRHMCHEVFSGAFDVEDVVGMVRNVYRGRVRFHDGDAALFPGISLHHIGGHTMGLQVVRVATRRGWVLLASDASHFYANMEQVRPFPIVYSVADMVAGYARMRTLADSPDHVIPGHDPQVMERYPAPRKDLQGIVVRLD